MSTHKVENQSNWVNALWTQGKVESKSSGALQCPYCHPGTLFQGTEQLWEHTKFEHAAQIVNKDARQVQDLALKLRKSDQSLDATAGVSTPDITVLSLNSGEERKYSPPSSKKRRADSEFSSRRKSPIKMEAPIKVEVADSEFLTDMPHAIALEQDRPKPQEARHFDYKKDAKHIAPPKQYSRVNKPTEKKHRKIERPPSIDQKPEHLPQGPGIAGSTKPDPRYPDLLLQPDSRPISQEQLASEVKSIYAGLTMVELKCKDVDQNLLQARRSNPEQTLTSEHWQALIALHRTLLHEHHDFFLASQHPSASPALRRLAAKYNMPGRMWRIGIHPFLEELRERIPVEGRSDDGRDPQCRDHMMAFIYLTYQMMALLYETVPAFEETWMECLGDLSRYRMAIENKEVQDRDTWTNVARSWYQKAADKNPLVGRLPHHLAILAQSNALQQLHYYAKSLTCVDPFFSARSSMLNLLDHALGRRLETNYSYAFAHALPIDASFITIHAHLFDNLSEAGVETAIQEFTANLDNHIGRVTAKWKEQGVYVAVSNIAAWFGYGLNLNIFRQAFLLLARQRRPAGENLLYTPKNSHELSDPLQITEGQIPSLLSTYISTPVFCQAAAFTNDTFALVLRRLGDQNVLPHVHVMLSFLTTLASSTYVTNTIDRTPWNELVSFLNALVKIENRKSQNQDVNALVTTPVFPNNGNVRERDEYPLPEDYQMRGLVWAQEYFPVNWFGREQDEGDRDLELASTTRSRTERVLRLGYLLSTFGRWTSYDKVTHMFSVLRH